jgi:SAM-dependent methyltransferase
MTATNPNHQYWQHRPGEAYRKTHDLRISRGVTNYAAQEAWLTDHLTKMKASRSRPLRLLDFGCGYGRIAHLCAAIGDIDYHGFDFSSAMVEPLYEAPPLPYAVDIRERVRIAPIADGLFDPKSFDVVLTISVFIHNDEADARRLFNTLATLRRPDGEIILIENPLAARTVMVNAWHGGCWNHDFSSFASEEMQILVDEEIHPGHAGYIFSTASREERFIRRKGGSVSRFSTHAAFLNGVATTQSFSALDPDDTLSLASALDSFEEHTRMPMIADPNVHITPAYREALRQHVIEKYIGSANFSYSPSSFESTLYDHVEGRFLSFKDGVLPWLMRRVDLMGKRIVEVGSGTGASTLALLPHVAHVDCFEIHGASCDVAEARMALAGYSNFTLHRQLFAGDTASSLGTVDGVVLAAVLEHTTFEECIAILRNAWNVLAPGGWLCVVDTPNRLCPFDHHTAMLPFFHMLPAEVRLAYASESPRSDFAGAFAAGVQRESGEALESLTRWGCGISYHEFELAIGKDVHQHIVAHGYEDEIVDLIGILPEDTTCELLLSMFAKHVHRAFSRRAFHLILQKPA